MHAHHLCYSIAGVFSLTAIDDRGQGKKIYWGIQLLVRTLGTQVQGRSCSPHVLGYEQSIQPGHSKSPSFKLKNWCHRHLCGIPQWVHTFFCSGESASQETVFVLLAGWGHVKLHTLLCIHCLRTNKRCIMKGPKLGKRRSEMEVRSTENI